MMTLPSLAIVMSAAGLAAGIGFQPAAADVKPTISRLERCRVLDLQLGKALAARPGGRMTADARSLEGKGMKLCLEHREAQGLRTLAEALRDLGVKPIDP
jgi:hypothetical protein